MLLIALSRIFCFSVLDFVEVAALLVFDEDARPCFRKVGFSLFPLSDLRLGCIRELFLLGSCNKIDSSERLASSCLFLLRKLGLC